MYKLYVDDIRTPTDVTNWLVVRSYKEAINVMKRNGCPSYISFDHDLGNDNKSGFDLVKWMVEKDMDTQMFFPKGFMFSCHSANPVGKENIETFLNNYLKHKSFNLGV